MSNKNSNKTLNWKKYIPDIQEFYKNHQVWEYSKLMEYLKEKTLSRWDKNFSELVSMISLKTKVNRLNRKWYLNLKTTTINWNGYKDMIIQYYNENEICDLNELYNNVIHKARDKKDEDFLSKITFSRFKRQIRALEEDEKKIVTKGKNNTDRLIWKDDYDNYIVENSWSKDIPRICKEIKDKAISRKDYVFAKNIKESDVFKRISSLNKKIAWREVFTLMWDKYKEHFKKVYLYKHFRSESIIWRTREYIIETVKDRKGKQIKPIKILWLEELKEKHSNNNYSFELTLTDMHINEHFFISEDVKWNVNVAMRDLNKVTNYLVKYLKQNPSIKELTINNNGDTLWTKIHNEIELDIEPIRASKIIAWAVFQMLVAVRKELPDISVTYRTVPGNHSETRVNWEKPNLFAENYDFIFAEELKILQKIYWDEKIQVFSPNRHYEFSYFERWNILQVHWDRRTSIHKFQPKIRALYNKSLVRYWYYWHYHMENFFIEENVLKMFFPAFTRPNYYALNNYGWTFRRDPQKAMVFNTNDNQYNLEKIINIDIDLIEEFWLKEYINIDTKKDISWIFDDVLKSF